MDIKMLRAFIRNDFEHSFINAGEDKYYLYEYPNMFFPEWSGFYMSNYNKVRYDENKFVCAMMTLPKDRWFCSKSILGRWTTTKEKFRKDIEQYEKPKLCTDTLSLNLLISSTLHDLDLLRYRGP